MSIMQSTEPVEIPVNDLVGTNPVVVLAPHPDDETLGCGGLLASAFTDRGAHVICMTDGSASHPGSTLWPPDRLARQRHRELVDALTCLGGGEDDLTWLGFPDGALGDCEPGQIAGRIAAICERVGASHLFAPSPLDHHADHKATAAIALHVVALLPRLRLFYYPVWSRWDDPDFKESHSGWPLWRLSTATHRTEKSNALRAHRSQLGLVVTDVAGFCLEPEMARCFCQEDEYYCEVTPCP